MLAQLSFNHAFFIAFWLGFVLICWYSKMKFDTKVDFERTDSIMPIWVTWESTTQPFVDKQISYSHVIIVSSWSVTRSLKDILTWPQSNLTYLEGKIKLYLISSKLSSFFQPSRLWFQWSDESCVLPWLLNVFLTFTCWFWRLERNLASILIRCFYPRSPIAHQLKETTPRPPFNSIRPPINSHTRAHHPFVSLRTASEPSLRLTPDNISWNWNFRRRSFVYVRAPTDTGSTQRTEQVSVIVVSNVDFWLFDLQLIANSSPTASLLPSAAALRTGSIESVCFNR